MPAPRPHTIPLALGSDGSLILNIACGSAEADIATLVRQARREGRQLFVGIVLNEREHQAALRRLDNASAEAAAQLSGARKAPRKSARSKAATTPRSRKVSR
ncbi:MAG TPA: hypothetical protein VK524_22355 [Polyangiaceae bacterium]|nr:hypothetical protein [Polyangiaceae bacterium]